MADDKLYRFIKEKSRLVPVAIIRNSLIRHGYPRKLVDEAARKVILEQREEHWLDEKTKIFRDFSSDSESKEERKPKEPDRPSDDFVPISELESPAGESSSHDISSDDLLSENQKPVVSAQKESRDVFSEIRTIAAGSNGERPSKASFFSSLRKKIPFSSSSDSHEAGKAPSVSRSISLQSHPPRTLLARSAPSSFSSSIEHKDSSGKQEDSSESSLTQNTEQPLNMKRARFELRIPLRLLLRAEFKEAFVSAKRMLSMIDPVHFTYFLLAVFSAFSVFLLVVFIKSSFFGILSKFILSSMMVISIALAFIVLERKYSIPHSDRFAFEISLTLGTAGWIVSSIFSPLFLFTLVFPGFIPVAFFIRKLYGLDEKLASKIAFLITLVAFGAFYISGLLLGILIGIRRFIL